MELKKLRCPECGANFESDEKVSFCSHCGAKLFFDDGTKTVNYNYNYKTEDVTKIKEVEANKELELNKMKEEACSQRYALLIGLSMLAVVFIFAGISAMISSNNSKLQERELQSIVSEIYSDIDAENYETALLKAKSLQYTANWSSGSKEKWNSTRESLIKLIEEKMKK